MTSLSARLRGRLASNGGFTLVELLVVLVIIGVLVAIAVPSYLGYRDRSLRSTVQANVRESLHSVEAYFADNRTYTGMTLAALTAIDRGVSPTLKVSVGVGGTTYCLSDQQGSHIGRVDGPGGQVGIAATACS
jgi:type IV pilus assembly protein PilA